MKKDTLKVSQAGACIGLSSADLHVLARRLENVLASGDAEQVRSLSVSISDSIEEHLYLLPEAVASAVSGEESTDATIEAAFSMGHLKFAHLLLEHVAHRSPAPLFYDAFNDPTYAEYLENLARSDYTNVELSNLTGQTPETVSRKLKHLRQLGLANVRRIGKHAVNSLTVAARANYADREFNVAPSVHPQTRANLFSVVEVLNLHIPDYLRNQPVLDRKAKPTADV